MTDAVIRSTEHGPGEDRHFGEEGGRLTYGSYLRVNQILSAQHLKSDPSAHDELLFITVHQVYELWFQHLLHELTPVRVAMCRQPVVGTAPAPAFLSGAKDPKYLDRFRGRRRVRRSDSSGGGPSRRRGTRSSASYGVRGCPPRTTRR